MLVTKASHIVLHEFHSKIEILLFQLNSSESNLKQSTLAIILRQNV